MTGAPRQERMPTAVACLAACGFIVVTLGVPALPVDVRASGQAAVAQPTFSAQAEMVVLHVTVQDRRGRYLTDLDRDAFAVVEDGVPQQVRHFSAVDAPVSIGLVIDGSGSMLHKRELVVAAALAFAEQSNPEDELFVLTFNEHVRQAWAPQLLRDTAWPVLRATLTSGIQARGLTALHDAVSAGLERLRQSRHTRQVLLVISDGGDNASAVAREDLIVRGRRSSAVIYTVALDDPVDRDGDPALLKALAEATGGEAFEPRRLRDLERVLPRIARDIRSAYTIGYVSTNAARDGAFRKIRVVVTPPDGQRLDVRTRAGYHAGRDESGGRNDT